MYIENFTMDFTSIKCLIFLNLSFLYFVSLSYFCYEDGNGSEGRKRLGSLVGLHLQIQEESIKGSYIERVLYTHPKSKGSDVPSKSFGNKWVP